MNESKKTIFVGFKCPMDLYEKYLEPLDNKSKFIVDSIRLTPLRKAFKELVNLFKMEVNYFKIHDIISIEEFSKMIDNFITDKKLIDEMMEVIE